MKEIVLSPRELTPGLAREMEERKLVSFIRHPAEELRAGLAKNYMKGDDFSARIHVFHSVTITYRDVFLASHPEGQDEIVFNWDSAPAAKPLYYVFSLLKREPYLARLDAGEAEPSDYVAIRAPMNDPCFSSFVVWHGTVHCECTNPAHRAAQYPSFFVLEPKALVVNRTEENSRGLRLVLAP